MALRNKIAQPWNCETCKTLENNLNTSKKKSDSLYKELESQNYTNARLKEEMDSCQYNIELQISQIEKHEQELEMLTNNCEKFRKRNLDSKNQIPTNIDNKIKDFLEDTSRTAEEMAKKNITLKNEITELEKEISLIEESNIENSKKHDSEKKKLEKEYFNLKSDKEKAIDDIDVIKSQMLESIETIEKDKNICNDEIENIKSQNQKLYNLLMETLESLDSSKLNPDLIALSTNKYPFIDEIIQDLKIIKENKLTGGSNTFKEKDPYKLYDSVVTVTTFYDLIKGNGWKTVTDLDKLATNTKKSCTVSIIGNFNRGKTFILSYLSNRLLPTGYNVHTEGISCIYPQEKDEPISYLDSAGFEVPISRKQNKEEEKKYDISSQKEKKEFDGKESDYILDKPIIDKQFTDIFMQRFLVETSDVILIVVGQLTFSDQKLINRILVEFEHRKDKRIVILHNFCNLYKIKDVKVQIKRDIQRCYDVDKMNIANSIIKDINREFNNKYYIRKNSTVCHLIFAREGSEAGFYYNESSKNYLTSVIVTQVGQRDFKLEDKIQSYLKENIHNYFVINDPDNVKFIKENTSEPGSTIMKLNLPQPIKIRSWTFDDLGAINFHKNIIANCVFFETPGEQEEFVWIVDLPGCSENDKNDRKKLNFGLVDDTDHFYNKVSCPNKFIQDYLEPIKNDINIINDRTRKNDGGLACETPKFDYRRWREFDFGKKQVTIHDGVLELRWPKLKKNESDYFMK